MYRSRPIAACLLVLSLVPAAYADDAPISRREIDSRIDEAVYRTIVTGLPLYNERDFKSCYRLYQGTLLGVDPLLAHHPELRQTIEKGLKEAENAASEAQKAVELRKTLDAVLAGVRAAIPLSTPAPPATPAPTSKPA
jgi:hypothetical protein